MINISNRLPTKPGRRLIAPEEGGAPFFATLIRADEPDDIGTPVDRATLMAMQGFIGSLTLFNEDGSITETNQDGDTLLTEFSGDGSITETFTSNSVNVRKRTVFRSDGSIEEELV